MKDKLVASIAKKEQLSYTDEELELKTLAQLRAICDGLELNYEEDNTEEELKSLILG